MKLLQLVGLLGENGLTAGVLFLSLIEVVRFVRGWWERRSASTQASSAPPPPSATQPDDLTWLEFRQWQALRRQGDVVKSRIVDISNHGRRAG